MYLPIPKGVFAKRASIPMVRLRSPFSVVYALSVMIRSIIHSLGSQKRIAGGALILATTQFGASFAGLIRDRVLAGTFPPGVDQLDTVSVYISAFRPSDLLFQMFVMSAFSVALVPMLASHLAHDRKKNMDQLLTKVLVVSGIVFGLLALLLAIFMRELAPLFVSFQGESLELYIRFAKIACFTNFLFVAGNAFGQYLIVRQTYWSYGLTPIIYTVGTIAGAIWLTGAFGPYGPIYGTVVGAAIYVLVRTWSCMRQGFKLRLEKSDDTKGELKEMGMLMLPRMIALGAMQFQLLLFDKVASGLTLGSVTINAYARNFQAAAVGVVGIALAQSSYSLLSQAIARGEISKFKSILRKGAFLTVGLTVPAAIVLALLARVAAMIVNLNDAQIVSTFVIALSLYAISIPFESLNHLLLRAVYSTKHTAVPAMLTVINGALAITCAWIFAPSYGVFALAVGFTVGQIVQMVGLWGFLRLRIRRII